MKKYVSLGLGLLLVCGSSLASAQTFPYCNGANADPDGDGWGWENNQSCRMPATCTSANSDPDGDGWGWENNQSCKVGTNSSVPNCASASSDPDGDGWGWENNRSCKVVNNGTAFPNCASASSDPDGDGWGWENNRSCKVVTTRISRIMPLGDSITGAPGCWRAILWNDLATYGYKNLNFVGTLNAQHCGLQHDADNEGHGGFLATNIANNNLLPGWLQNTNPDLVLMHLGTNDVWSNVSTQNILNAYTKLISQMRAKNPRVTVLVAKILPMNPNGCSPCGQRAVNLNNAIPNWANSLSTSQSPIRVVDQWSGFNTNTDTSDGVHPNDSGNYKIARNWLNAMTGVLTY